MIVSGDLFGGAERQLLTLCRAGKAYFDTTVVTTLPGSVARTIREAGVACEDFGATGGSALYCARRLAALLADRRIDVLHTHGYRSSVIAALARPTGRAVVRTVHGAPESARAPKVAFYEFLGRAADVWMRSRRVYVSRELASRFGPEKGSSVIYNGVDPPPEPGARPAEFTDQRFNLVVIGRLEPVKGLTYAIQAMAEDSIRDRALLHVVGDGPLRQQLEQAVVDANLSDAVRFCGFRDDALNMIAHADALLMSSLHEGIPYVALEAMASGTPVIATRVGGLPEVIRDGIDGLLVPAQSAAALASAVASLIDRPNLAAALAAAGPARVASGFGADAMAQQYARLYVDALAR